jgi:uracil-DNA glycosylase
MSAAIEELKQRLVAYRSGDVFNQYAEVHLDYDRPDGAERRLRNLVRYMEQFADARYVLVSEAPGYAGARTSGVWFTSERFLVGPAALPWTHGLQFERASRDDLPLRPELSATIVWSALGDRRDIAFWPSFPWHPMGARGPMSNRKPRREEVAVGQELLRWVLDNVWPDRQRLAIGRVGEVALQAMGYGEVGYIRHPAQGGATEFRRGIAALPRLD